MKTIARTRFVMTQVGRGITKEAAERAADHMIAGRVVPDSITDGHARNLAWQMIREAQGIVDPSDERR